MKAVAIISGICLLLGSIAEGRVTCYYGSWATYRYGNGKFDVEDIDPYLCDEVVYSFAGLDQTTYKIKVLDPYNDLYDNYGKGAYERFTGLKKINPNLRTTLAVGGWNEGSSKYSIMAADPSKREAFVSSSLELLLKYNFDGLDIDWEYPANRGGSPSDKENYVTLLQELKLALEPSGLTVTVAVAVGRGTVDLAYDIQSLSNTVDYIYLMAYDIHGAWESYTHQHAPLKPHPLDKDLQMNIEASVNYWISQGADAGKLVLGIPTYGRCYELSSSYAGFYAPSSGPAQAGPYTGENGIIGYNELCAMQLEQTWTTVLEPAMNEPYTYRSDKRFWCGFDDSASAARKAEYAKEMKLGGVMSWSLETDDFKGICGRRNIIIQSMRDAFAGDQQATTHTPNNSTAPTTNSPTTQSKPTTTPPTAAPPTLPTAPPTLPTAPPTLPTAPECLPVGNYYMPHEQCEKYWVCANGVAIMGSCPQPLYWDQDLKICNYSDQVDTSNCKQTEEVSHVYRHQPAA